MIDSNDSTTITFKRGKSVSCLQKLHSHKMLKAIRHLIIFGFTYLAGVHLRLYTVNKYVHTSNRVTIPLTTTFLQVLNTLFSSVDGKSVERLDLFHFECMYHSVCITHEHYCADVKRTKWFMDLSSDLLFLKPIRSCWSNGWNKIRCT